MCVCSSVGFAAGQTDNNKTLCSTERCKTKYFICASVAQLDRASDSDSEGRWFDSSQAHQKTPQKILRSFCFIDLLFRKRRFDYIFQEKADFIRPQGKTPTATLVVVEVV